MKKKFQMAFIGFLNTGFCKVTMTQIMKGNRKLSISLMGHKIEFDKKL